MLRLARPARLARLARLAQWAPAPRTTTDKRWAARLCCGTASPCKLRDRTPEVRRHTWPSDSLRHLDAAVVRFIDELRRILFQAARQVAKIAGSLTALAQQLFEFRQTLLREARNSGLVFRHEAFQEVRG